MKLPQPKFNTRPPMPMQSQMQPGQVNSTLDLHKMAMGIAMSNMLKKKKKQKQGN